MHIISIILQILAVTCRRKVVVSNRLRHDLQHNFSTVNSRRTFAVAMCSVDSHQNHYVGPVCKFPQAFHNINNNFTAIYVPPSADKYSNVLQPYMSLAAVV